jgi:hypothetical protein
MDLERPSLPSRALRTLPHLQNNRYGPIRVELWSTAHLGLLTATPGSSELQITETSGMSGSTINKA